MDANEVRRKLEVYVKKNGVKYKYIANQIKISESMLSHWRKGRKELGAKKLEALNEYLIDLK